MAIIKELNGTAPKFGERCFLAENAALIGDVKMGDDCSIWYGTVLRGDVNPIVIGDRVNIQDGAVIPDNTIIAAGAVVLSNQVLEPGVYAGIPAKKVKDSSEAVAEAAHKNAQGYLLYKDWYKE